MAGLCAGIGVRGVVNTLWQRCYPSLERFSFVYSEGKAGGLALASSEGSRAKAVEGGRGPAYRPKNICFCPRPPLNRHIIIYFLFIPHLPQGLYSPAHVPDC